MAVARHRQYSFPESLASTSDFYFELDTLVSPSDDFYDSVSPSENIWKKFELLPTPPLSPQRDEDDDDDCAFSSECTKKDDEWLTTAIFDTKSLPSGGLKSKLIQDCMWSGSDEEQARSHRSRKVSLSELTMITTSTSCVDPTTFSAFPRQQNQVEHSYSLTTPEPMRVPPMYTPAQTDDDSESEEDVIDVVTVDTRVPSSMQNIHNKSLYKIRNNLQAVANRLTTDAYKRPKCLSDHDFTQPHKKARKLMSHNSLLSSQNSSDSEDFEGKRSAHNVMERQRRNDLKNSLHILRDSLPSLETQERAPKVVILAHATQYMHELQTGDHKLTAELRQVKSKNARLKERLEQLQAQVSFMSVTM